MKQKINNLIKIVCLFQFLRKLSLPLHLTKLLMMNLLITGSNLDIQINLISKVNLNY
jgi:hypothetical protein